MKKKLLALGMCLSLALTGCSAATEQITEGLTEAAKDIAETAQEETNAEVAEEETEAEEAPEVETLKLGKSAKIGDWKVTVKKAQAKKLIRQSSYYVFKPTKGSTFICVSMKVQNKGKKEDTFLPKFGYEDEDNFATLYYEDYEYKAGYLTSYDKDLMDESIKPLTTKNGIIVFEVPKKVAKKKGKLTLKIGTTQDYVIYKLK